MRGVNNTTGVALVEVYHLDEQVVGNNNRANFRALAQQQKQIDVLTAGLQKVSAQLETSKPAPQVVSNNQ